MKKGLTLMLHINLLYYRYAAIVKAMQLRQLRVVYGFPAARFGYLGRVL